MIPLPLMVKISPENYSFTLQEPIMRNAHPLLSDRMVLPTNQLEELTIELDCWLNDLSTGGCVYADQRLGKTMATRFLIDHLPILIGADIPRIIISIWEPTPSSTTESRFFMELLRSFNHEYPTSGTAADKRIRLLNLIEDEVRRKNEHRFLLFLDEAQLLTNAQLRFLMDLHNQLKLVDIRLITILVGQPELRHERTNLLKSGNHNLVSRFYCNEYKFRGLSSEADLRTILKHIDKNTEWPKGSGITYTQHFVPIAFKNSWRLEHQSKRIWKQLQSAMAERGVSHVKELPMQGIVALIRSLLRYAQKADSKDLALSDKLINARVKKVAMSNIENHALQLKYEREIEGRASKRKAA